MSQTTDLTTKEQTSSATHEPSRIKMTPLVDVYENDDEILITADLPGVRPDQVDVHLDGRALSLSAWQDPPDNPAKYRAAEFERAFRVPDTIDPNGIEAHLTDGVLTLHLKKSEAAKPRRIQVRSAD